MVLGYIIACAAAYIRDDSNPHQCAYNVNNLCRFSSEAPKASCFGRFAKLISIIPAMMMAGLVKDLNKIVGFSGLTGFVIISVSALMIIKGRKLCKQHFGDANLRTPFNSWSSHIAIIYTILVITGVGFILTTYSVVADAIGKASPRYVSEYPDCKITRVPRPCLLFPLLLIIVRTIKINSQDVFFCYDDPPHR